MEYVVEIPENPVTLDEFSALVKRYYDERTKEVVVELERCSDSQDNDGRNVCEAVIGHVCNECDEIIKTAYVYGYEAPIDPSVKPEVSEESLYGCAEVPFCLNCDPPDMLEGEPAYSKPLFLRLSDEDLTD